MLQTLLLGMIFSSSIGSRFRVLGLCRRSGTALQLYLETLLMVQAVYIDPKIH